MLFQLKIKENLPPPPKISTKRRILTRKGVMKGARVPNCCYLIPYHKLARHYMQLKFFWQWIITWKQRIIYIYVYHLSFINKKILKIADPKFSFFFCLKGGVEIIIFYLVHFLRKQEQRLRGGVVVAGGSGTALKRFPPMVSMIGYYKVKYRAKWTGILCSLFTS